MALKIYFAGAIRGGRDDAEYYTRLIRHLQCYGTVLTEHVGDAALLADEQAMNEEAIFDRDMQWLVAADLVIAEVSTPSLGVGFEIARAQALGKPICCLFRKGAARRLSAMISGNRGVEVFFYTSDDEAASISAAFVERFAVNARETPPPTPGLVRN